MVIRTTSSNQAWKDVEENSTVLMT